MFTISLKRNLEDLAVIQQLPGLFFTKDIKGHQVSVETFKAKKPYAVSGTIKGFFVLANETTVSANGSISGNKAIVDVPESAYEVPGPITIIVKNIDGQVKTTLAACRCYVRKSKFT